MTTQDAPAVPTPAAPEATGFGTVYARRGSIRPQQYIQVDSSQLSPVLSRPPLTEYLGRLWQRRHFIMADSRARVEAGSRTNVLGKVWLVLRPLLDGAVYFMVFGMLLGASRGIENFVGYLLIGVFLFQFTVRSLNNGARSISASRTLIRSFAFPRASLPIASIVREVLSFVPVLVTLIVLVLALPYVMPVINPGGDPITAHVTWRWLLVPGVLALQVAMATGLALIAARIVSRVPDFLQLVSIGTRFWLYGSAVFFSLDRFSNLPTVQAIMQVNPMFIVLDMTRDCLLYGITPEWTSWALLGAWSGVLLVGGMVFFWLGEESYGSA